MNEENPMMIFVIYSIIVKIIYTAIYETIQYK